MRWLIGLVLATFTGSSGALLKEAVAATRKVVGAATATVGNAIQAGGRPVGWLLARVALPRLLAQFLTAASSSVIATASP